MLRSQICFFTCWCVCVGMGMGVCVCLCLFVSVCVCVCVCARAIETAQCYYKLIASISLREKC